MSTPYKILLEGLRFPEGPCFTPDGMLWGVELKGESLWNYDGKTCGRVNVGGEPNGMTCDRKGRVLFCDAGNRSIRRYDPATGSTVTLADNLDGKILGKPNDLAFDAAGNLLFTCPNDGRKEPTGYVCLVRPGSGGKVELLKDGMYFANGLAFSPDGNTLVVAETYKHRLWKGGWDAKTATWINPQPWAEVGGPIGPDGFAFGEDGNLYVAVYASGQIKIVSPDGKLSGALDLPGMNPTNCAFDPQGRYGLVVTETEKGLLVGFPELGRGTALFDGGASWD